MSEVNIFTSLEIFSLGFLMVIAAVQFNLYPFEGMCYTHRATQSRYLSYKQVRVRLDNLLHTLQTIKKQKKKNADVS